MVEVYNNSKGKFWEFTLNRAEIFKLCNRRSVALNSRLSEKKHINEIMEEDRGAFDIYYGQALSELIPKLAIYLEYPYTDTDTEGDNTYLTLKLTDSQDDSVAHTLDNYISLFLQYRVLKEWYGIESASLGLDQKCAEIEDNLLKIRGYRKKSAQRPINPIL